MSESYLSRRNILKGAGSLSAGLVLGTGILGASSSASAAPRNQNSAGPRNQNPADLSSHGLTVVDGVTDDPRMWYYKFATDAISFDPMVNVFVPPSYTQDDRSYPVLYLLHGGNQDFKTWDVEYDIRSLAADKELIIVMPDAGTGWYSNPVSSNVGPRNWETFHMEQLIPWVDETFRTHASADGRAVAGFSMGGFGALKYAAKYHGHFASVSSHSGPASLRRLDGRVVHWANATAAALELGLGTVYGAPWDEARVTADNPMENIEKYRDKRIFLVAGDSPDPLDLWGQMNENEVRAGQLDFRAALDDAGIAHDPRDPGGGHIPRPDLVGDDLAGIVGRLLPPQ